MSLRRFAFNNVIRNRRIYAGYFLSSVFSVMVFFVYSIFAFHPGLADGALHMSVSTAMHFAESVIYVFSFFFVLYSMGSFLKTRKKEFGILIMHGMTSMQLRRLVFMENIVIGFGATAAGIAAGLGFAQVILLLSQRLLSLDERLPFYFPTKAIVLTGAAFMALFLLISLFTVTVLRNNSLIDLLKGSNKPKPEPKASALLSWLALLLIVGGYAAALAAKGMIVFYAMIPVTVVVIIGTYFLFTQLSVYAVHKGRKSRSIFWRKTNIVLLSDLAYRMKDNARTFFMVAILSTVAFSAIGSLFGFKSMYTDIIRNDNPFAMKYTSYDKPSEQDVAMIEQTLKEAGLSYQSYALTVKNVETKDGKRLSVVPQSAFNALETAVKGTKADVQGDDAAIVHYRSTMMGAAQPELTPVTLKEAGITFKPVQTLDTPVIQAGSDYYVVPDERFEQLKQPESVIYQYAFDVSGSHDALKEAGEEIDGKLGKTDNWFMGVDYALYQQDQIFGVVLFVGFFIGIVFFVGAGSFLYFRLYTDLGEDKRKFQAIHKIGLTDRELSSILTKQLMILFFAPILVAVIHGAVALTAMQHMFEYGMVKPSLTVLGSFVVIQLVYFLLIRTKYISNVKSAWGLHLT
ncbi:putative ABC transport system permease protein [Paenibacillus sp. BK033]|uniref:FtsX-like permease family protein n=1 Tax=Paenibacillus sp. BK033 TaxID=2512133 RepID=UPI00104D2890|nr:FtsX-like permease family protein [Paenibacillus sp. BK033]TCM96964.1 putative ABC transport system permease protein [Paenibacillus sp. BK033]